MKAAYEILVHVVSMFDDSEVSIAAGTAEVRRCGACGSTKVNVTLYGYTKQARGKAYGYKDIDILIQMAAADLVRTHNTSCDLGSIEYSSAFA